MKCMVSWRVHDGKRHEALKHFSQMTNDAIWLIGESASN